jgi:hypothetical protein
MDHREELRVKNRVFPSGEKVGEPSLAGPEMMPGANISADELEAGTGACCAAELGSCWE